MSVTQNGLLSTDVYKMGHPEQYAPGTERVFEYLCARSDREFEEIVFFGLQYYLKRYLHGAVTHGNVKEMLDVREFILNRPNSADFTEKMNALASLGYWPLRIKAVPEGTVVPTKNALFTIESTHPAFFWAPGYVESMLLKVWYPIVVASNSYNYWKVITERTYDPTDFLVHDFGYRSDNSEEAAGISGAAHLIAFSGSDTVLAYPMIRDYYGPILPGTMCSIPATEHSVMCSYGIEGEMEAFERMLKLYPSGYVSIVSDTYDIYHVCTCILPRLKEEIMARDGCVVIRPDSGDPPNVICGDPEAIVREEQLGVLRLLDETFGHTINNQGRKKLDSHIGLIYGDGMYLERYTKTLDRMRGMGYDASNLVIGAGGILRRGTRDSIGGATKATQITRDGTIVDIMKQPVTDSGKRSHCGLVRLVMSQGKPVTQDRVTRRQEEASENLLKLVFEDGKLMHNFSWTEVRDNFKRTRKAITHGLN